MDLLGTSPLNSAETYLHMERYVNDGSPSGFTEAHATSDATSPFGDVDRFKLLAFRDDDIETELIGADVHPLRDGMNFAHPDSLNSLVLSRGERQLNPTSFSASPVSGGRTFLLRDAAAAGYLKLTYDVARIGRVDRQLTRNHCLGSLEASARLSSGIDQGLLGDEIGLMRETSARVSYLPTDGDTPYEWGTIFRESEPYPRATEDVQIVPGFSLFSADRHSPEDAPLLVQIIRSSGYDPEAYVEKLLTMIVSCYWKIVLNRALHIEAHAQNCFVEFGPDWMPRRFIVKDMDSVDKDLPLAAHLGIEYEWESYPYMCFDHKIYFYDIRASFMYDFKLGTYLLEPILRCVSRSFQMDAAAIALRIQKYVRESFLGQLPPNYFPADGRWYFADNSERLPGTQRIYQSKPDPLFR